MVKKYNYKKFAKYYDVIELENGAFAPGANSFIDHILKKYKVKTLLDFTAGTGSQALYLSKKYKVTANDLNKEMLDIARMKARRQRCKLKFNIGDVRYARLGRFDAIITIFNAIGHFDVDEFEKVLRNVKKNLKERGIYIFDIFNADYMRDNFISDKVIDVAIEHEGTKFVRFNNNRYDYKKGVMKIKQETWIQKGLSKPEILRAVWDLKIYTIDQLKDLLKKNGFKIVKVNGWWGPKFDRKGSVLIIVVAQKM